MPTRAETTAATRQALVAAAGALLDTGGPEAVTLREVGARAGVSRSALYRHFTGKEALLLELVIRTWTEIGDTLEELRGRLDLTPRQRAHDAFLALINLGRSRPDLYQLMFGAAPAEPDPVALRAAERGLDLYVAIAGDVVGEAKRHEYAALLMASAHGITGLELSGHLTDEKWHTDAERLLDDLVDLLPASA